MALKCGEPEGRGSRRDHGVAPGTESVFRSRASEGSSAELESVPGH